MLDVNQREELYTQAQWREVKTEEDRRRAADARLFVDLLLDAAATAPCTLVLTSAVWCYNRRRRTFKLCR
jgi:hypothetical protein